MAEPFIEDIKTKPVYVAFFHGEFDTCSNVSANQYADPTLVIPDNVSLMQLTQPGEFLVLSSSILYYLIHKKQFYTNVLMPLFAVDDPKSLLSHPDAKHIFWNMEDRKGHSFENIISSGKKLMSNSPAEALKIMKETTITKPYEAGDKSHFEKILRFSAGDEIPNLKLSRFDESMTGIGLYKYNPTTGLIVRIPIESIHRPGRFEARDSLRLHHLIHHINSVGGGRMILFSCSSLAHNPVYPKFNKAKSAIQRMAQYQEKYIAHNPVCSPTQNWDLFIRAFPKVIMPNLTFVNGTTLKAHDYKVLQWTLFNLLTKANFYADMPNRSLSESMRNTELQKTAIHGRHVQNIGQNLGNTVPLPGENTAAYMCRRGKEGCVVMGGTRKKTRKTRNTMRKKRI